MVKKNMWMNRSAKHRIILNRRISERISVGELALKFAIGRRHFERRFKKATKNTPVEYIQRVKIEAAKKHFETSQKKCERSYV